MTWENVAQHIVLCLAKWLIAVGSIGGGVVLMYRFFMHDIEKSERK